MRRKGRVYLGLVCLAVAVGAVLGIVFARGEIFSPAGDATADTAPVVTFVPEDGQFEFSLPAGECALLKIDSGAEEFITGWSTADASVVTVDSGGRIDGISPGSAAVTAAFNDGHAYTYLVTVTQAEPKQERDHFSTAYTANEEVMQKNLLAAEEVDMSEIYDPFTEPDTEAARLPFEIWVNRKKSCVTVYTYDDKGEYTVPVRAMICSCGKEGNETITGEFNLYFKAEWHYLVNDVYGRYVSGIDGDFLFHSVPYLDYAFDKLETDEFNKLGEPASMGCVRLSVSDSKWIYDNCAVGTVIKIFDSDDEGPLGCPPAMRVADLQNGWDPTDYNELNPYNTCYPKFSGLSDKAVPLGGAFSPTDGFSAVDSCGNDVTAGVEITGNVVTSRAGVYKLTYRYTDALNRSAEQTVTVTVE